MATSYQPASLISGSTLTLIAGQLATTTNVVSITGTLASSSATERGIDVQIAGAGSGANQITAFRVFLTTGYTGSGVTQGMAIRNQSLGTGTSGWIGGASNAGGEWVANGATSGHNVGGFFVGHNSSTLNLGASGRAISPTNSPAINVGLAGFARNATKVVAGLFCLLDVGGTPTISASAALIADNDTTTNAILIAQDGGVAVFTIADGGPVTATSTISASGFLVGATAGIDGTVTTGGLVGKTMTFTKGLFSGFA